MKLNAKQCTKCLKVLPLDNFHRSQKGSLGRQSKCKGCVQAYNKVWGAQGGYAKITSNNKRRYHELRAWIEKYLLEHPCLDCGEEDPIVLEFDHLRDKEMEISVMVSKLRSRSRILAEIEKCDVVCANCHRRRTWDRRLAAS